jgi:hypothetical protein
MKHPKKGAVNPRHGTGNCFSSKCHPPFPVAISSPPNTVRTQAATLGAPNGGPARLLAAATVGGVRLIDNMGLDTPDSP